MKKIYFVIVFSLSSCANPYTTFYKGLPDARALPPYEVVSNDIQIYQTNDFNKDVHILEKKGYMPIGQSFFNAANNKISESKVRDQTKKIGAHLVLTSSRYTNTATGAMPLTAPNTSTSYSTSNTTVYGPGGTANVRGTGSTTTPGNQTVMMPYSIDRSDFGAVYLVKIHPRVGIIAMAVDDETRKSARNQRGHKSSCSDRRITSLHS
jgi:hypothetical protein